MELRHRTHHPLPTDVAPPISQSSLDSASSTAAKKHSPTHHHGRQQEKQPKGGGSPSRATHHRRPRVKRVSHSSSVGRRRQFTIASKVIVGVMSTFFLYQWTWQMLDYLHDMRKESGRQKGRIALRYKVPLDILPSYNWPKPFRFLRPHNQRIVTDARNSIIELGNELRGLLQQEQKGKKYLMPWAEEEGQQKEREAIAANDALLFRKRLRARAAWLRGDSTQPHWPLSELPIPVDGQALVISAGNKQLDYLKTLVYTIRVIYQSSIPIRVTYRDDKDLSKGAQQKVLEAVTAANVDPGDIKFLDLSKYFDLEIIQVAGWNLKAFGMLAVPETQVASLDVDVLLYQPPEHLFKAKGYQETGALFFHDRVKPQFFWDVHTYARWLQPNLSSQAEKSLLYGKGIAGSFYSEQIQESGVMVVDKKRRSLGLWAACLIFGRVDIRKYLQTDHMYGDKEIFWTAFEAIQEPYKFARYYPGIVGGTMTDFWSQVSLHLDETDPLVRNSIRDEAEELGRSLCGRLLHLDDSGLPLWSNGGYMLKEDDWTSYNRMSFSALNPTWFVDGGDSATEDFVNPWLLFFRNILGLHSTLKHENQLWAMYWRMSVECLARNAREIRNVPEESATVARKAVKYYFDNRSKRPDPP